MNDEVRLAWKEWEKEQVRDYSEFDLTSVFLDSFIGLALLLVSWFWLPGLFTLKIYRWLCKQSD